MKNIQQQVIDGKVNPYELLEFWNEKELSRNDIESLGFKLKVENKYGITFANRLYSIVYSKMKSNHLEIFLIQPYVNEYDGLKFSGVIKNKSELKILLEQLNIYQNV